MVQRITLYTAKVCPFAQRAEIALALANADWKEYEVDLQNKPEWYAPQVNPASKVPAIAYGGPDVPPEHPSPESIKIAESAVVVEFIADLFPHAGIMPADPVQRAQARFFVDAVGTKFVSPWLAYVMKGENGSSFMDAAAALEKLLSAKYAVGDQITAADIAFVPFLLRTEYGLKLRDTESVLAQLQERTPRLWQYYVDVKAHPSVQKTWDEAGFYRHYQTRVLGGK